MDEELKEILREIATSLRERNELRRKEVEELGRMRTEHEALVRESMERFKSLRNPLADPKSIVGDAMHREGRIAREELRKFQAQVFDELKEIRATLSKLIEKS